jgi:LemA protein
VTTLLIVVGLIALLAIVVGFTYNRIVARRNAVDNSWAQIETALQRRHDLIPNLVEAVKGYASHERRTFEEVTRARSTAMAAKAPPSQAAAEGTLAQTLGGLIAVSEQYPQLRASENFQKLQTSLTEAEDQIAITRRVYNDTVQTYNTLIQIFPVVLIARPLGFRAREFFDAPVEAEATPEVRISDRAATRPAPAITPED